MEKTFLLNAYKSVFDLMPVPALLLKPDYPHFTVLDANRKYLEATGASRNALLGHGLPAMELNDDFEHGSEVMESIIGGLQQVLLLKEPIEQGDFRFDVRLHGSTSFTRKIWRATNTPILDETGNVAFILHTPVDVTEVHDLQEKGKHIQKASEAQKEFYENIFLQAPVGIGVFEGREFEVINLNPDLARFYNRSPSELIGKKIFEVFPKAKEVWGPILTQVFTSGKPYRGIELEVDLSSEGEARPSYVNFGMVPYHDPAGNTIGIICVSADVTKQVTLRKTIEDNELMMKIAAESAQLGIWDIDLQTEMVYSSSHLWMKDFPMDKGRYPISDFISHVMPEDREKVVDSIHHSEGIFATQIRIKWADNSIHWLQLTGMIIRNGKEKPIRVVGTTLDITERKELERRKDELITTVSHELKTPVTSIKAIAQILDKKLNSSGDKGTSELVTKLVNQIKRLTNLIHDLLDASLIEGGKLQLKKGQFKFNELIEEVVVETEKTFPTHGIILEDNPVIDCFSDKERLRQVLVNLLGNAIKYSPGREKVIVNVQYDQGRISCCVCDFGVGIPEEKASQIFERFYRIIDDKHYGFQGIGIGLYISKQIIDRLNGKIWFKSNPEGGTTFCFEVPSE